MVESVGRMSDNCQPELVCKQTSKAPNLGLPRSVMITALLEAFTFLLLPSIIHLHACACLRVSELIEQSTARPWPTSSWFS
jgi:hypothetical protein